MKFAYLAAIAALSFSTPSLAAQTVSTNVTAGAYHGTPGGIYNTITSLVISTAGNYSFSLGIDLLSGTSLATVGADIFKGSATTPLASIFKFTTADATKSTGEFWLDAGTYKVSWDITSFGGKTAATLSANSVTAVPGPEAGAGLGALAMLGVAYLAKRRRDEKALAA
ncbi:hypothetical protein [Aliirhizobium smilacinae]|uniref:PEP-CTERM sorting domain-containing protein n=1 Tax=Aliirhizobium smilacinae TaxID=1395944 RepID=A0A5C4XRS6_9HYPH|nr:hypothetical protein [Rhizobium smilacinae]TNM65294.1 hypothetical protein FHP24_03160 [Rhizobium smilacinae]